MEEFSDCGQNEDEEEDDADLSLCKNKKASSLVQSECDVSDAEKSDKDVSDNVQEESDVDDDDDDGKDDDYNENKEDSQSESEEIFGGQTSTKKRTRIIVQDDSDNEEPEAMQSILVDSECLREEESSIENEPSMSQQKINTDLIDDMLDLESRNINVTQSENVVENNANLFTQKVDEISDSQLLDLCSGTFATQAQPVRCGYNFDSITFKFNFM